MNESYKVLISYVEIYNENIFDLLEFTGKNLILREDSNLGFYVEGLKRHEIYSYVEGFDYLKIGSNNRKTASNKLNISSSRSHAIFRVELFQKEEDDYYFLGKINFVDLAGSEWLWITNATGQRLEECKKINQSLSELANVISALSDKNYRTHIPYWNSKLTKLLEDSLGGNSKTVVLSTITPHIDAFSETFSTLKFSARARKVQISLVSNKK